MKTLQLEFPDEIETFVYVPWKGSQKGPTFETLIQLQNKALSKDSFTAKEEFLWNEYNFAPTGYRYDTTGTLHQIP